MKFWATNIQVKILEFEFTIPHVVRAETDNEADDIIKEYARNFYDGPVDETDLGFEFFGGCPIVTYSMLHETTKEAWQENKWKSAVIGGA